MDDMANMPEHANLQASGPRFQEQYSETEQSPCYESTIRCCGTCSGFINTWICCCLPSPYQEIPQGFVGVVQEFGKFKRILNPGLNYINPYSESVIKVDTKETLLDLKRQSVMTKDNVNITIDAVVYYQINNPEKSLFMVEDVRKAIEEIAKTTLRDVFGNIMLQEAVETKEKMSTQIKEIIDKPTDSWGVDVRRVLIQEIFFSKDLQSNLSAAATAKRIAEGKVINAQADVDSAQLMKEASEALNTQAAMQIRYLESLTTLAKSPNTKIIFMPNES